MALGKPVIATDGGGTNEILENNKTGFLIDPSDPEMLLEKMELLLNNAALRDTMGMTGKKRIQDHFSIDKMVRDYILYYNSLLGQGN